MKKQYGSVASFSQASGIPYSTIVNALNKGVGTMAYDTVVKMCGLLNINQAFSSRLILFDDRFLELYDKLNVLDDQGLNTVSTVLKAEFLRCTADGDTPVKGFNGIGFAVKETAQDKARMRTLSRKGCNEQT